MFDIKDLLSLSAVPGVGSNRLRALVSHFKDPAAVFHSSARELIKVRGIDKKTAVNIVRFRDGRKFADQQLSRLNNVEGRIITFWDDEYPELLRKIYDPPPFLFMLGSIIPSDSLAIAIVGTRAPTMYGKIVAEKFSGQLAEMGLTIVSGLARGIDTVAHTAGLKAGGRTIAVIGSGIDIIYPPENKRLAEKISRRGAILSEFEMGARPDAVNFPRRNRIISGFALGTLIVETTESGGAMITANTALDQNREVFAIPGPITEIRSSGTNRLIKEGRAKLVQRVEDIVSELQVKLRPLLKREEKKIESPLSLFEKRLLDCLGTEPLHIDTIAAQTALATSDALVNLLSLEFKSLVRQLPGKMFVRL
ncbi:MAG: DNA-processing protein DprA [Bacteroidota bacterium]